MSITPRAREQLIRLQAVFPEVAKTYEGTAVLAPTAMALGRAAGISGYNLPKGGTGKHSWTLETITGLQVVHEGFVLGNVENVGEVRPEDMPATIEPINPIYIEKLASEIDILPEEAKQKLFDRLSNGQ